MFKRVLVLALIVGLGSLGPACNRSRKETHDRPGSAPRMEQEARSRMIYPPRPAGDPNVIAPPRPVTNTADQGEGAGIAAGHTFSEQKNH